MQHGEAAAAESFRAADAPGVFVRAGKTIACHLDLPAAFLLEPVEAAETLEFGGEPVAQGGQVVDVERGVIEQSLVSGRLDQLAFW